MGTWRAAFAWHLNPTDTVLHSARIQERALVILLKAEEAASELGLDSEETVQTQALKTVIRASETVLLELKNSSKLEVGKSLEKMWASESQSLAIRQMSQYHCKSC